MESDSGTVHFGEVIWFSAGKGFGFSSWSKNGVEQADIFIHFSDIVSDGFKTLNKGQKISFRIGKNRNGLPKAIEVIALRH